MDDVQTSTYVLFIVFTFAIKMAAFNCASSQTKLTTDLLVAVRANWNRVLSPALIQSSLLVAAIGSKRNSKTESELIQAAHVKGPKASLANKLQKLSQNIESYNELYVNNRLDLHRNFRHLLSFKSSYRNFTQNEESANVIYENLAVKMKTQLIPTDTLIKASYMDTDTTMIAVNAVNLNVSWCKKFPYNKTSNTIHVTGRHKYGHLAKLNATALVLQFRKSQNVFLIIFADEASQLMPLQARLRSVDVLRIPSGLKRRPVNLNIPAFNFRTINSVNTAILGRLNVTKALAGKAEFVNFFKQPSRSYLKLLKQFSAINITANGVEFASATGVQYELTDSYVSYAAKAMDEGSAGTNPFFYFIIKEGNILAAGSSYNGN